MTTGDFVLLTGVSVQLLAILALAVSVWSLGQRIGAHIDGLADPLSGLADRVSGLANDVTTSTVAIERLTSRLDEHTRHHP